MRIRTILFGLLPVVIASVAGQLLAGSYSSIRCGTYLVDVGAPRHEVIAKCGEPDDVQASVVERKKGYVYRWQADDDQSRVVRFREDPYLDEFRTQTVTVQRETLFYDMGRSSFVRRLIVEDGVLMRIETGDYGR